MPAHAGQLEIDEIGRHRQCVVQSLTLERPVGLRLEREHGIPEVECGQDRTAERPTGAARLYLGEVWAPQAVTTYQGEL